MQTPQHLLIVNEIATCRPHQRLEGGLAHLQLRLQLVPCAWLADGLNLVACDAERRFPLSAEDQRSNDE